MAKRRYSKPEIRPLDKVVALLEMWASWRGTVRQVMRLRSSPQCNLGRLVRMGRQAAEMWEHNRVDPPEIFDDALMCHVDRVVAGMEPRIRETIMLAYVNGRYFSPRRRAKKLGCTERMYYYRLKDGHEILEKSVDWDKIGR